MTFVIWCYDLDMSINARDMKFDLSSEIAGHWCPDQPEFSHLATSFMGALPYLEPYFIHNIREAAALLKDDVLHGEIEGFIKQEARHAQQHRSWNQLIGQRYPEFHKLEHALRDRLSQSKRKHSLAFRMAYTSGYEAFTYQLVCFIMKRRHELFAGADPRIVAMLSWHAAEEVEHKSVAFDVFQAIHGGYFMRIWGYAAALIQSHRDIQAMTHHLLEADGKWSDRAAQRRLRAIRLSLLRHLVPELRHYFRPGYRPSEHSDPPVLLAWIERHRQGHDLRTLNLAQLDELSRSAEQVA
jgi:predicted metal-dependent hydrolase